MPRTATMKPEDPVFKKDAGLVFLSCGVVASLLAYCYTTFATVDYVKNYVDLRHEEVLRRLEKIDTNVDKLLEDWFRNKK